MYRLPSLDSVVSTRTGWVSRNQKKWLINMQRFQRVTLKSRKKSLISSIGGRNNLNKRRSDIIPDIFNLSIGEQQFRFNFRPGGCKIMDWRLAFIWAVWFLLLLVVPRSKLARPLSLAHHKSIILHIHRLSTVEGGGSLHSRSLHILIKLDASNQDRIAFSQPWKKTLSKCWLKLTECMIWDWELCTNESIHKEGS